MNRLHFVSIVICVVFLFSVLVSTMPVHAKATGWSVQTVDDNALLWGVSVALDSHGNPHICYLGSISNSNLTTNRYLKYASWNGSNWNIQTLTPIENVWVGFDCQSLAMDSHDNPHIAVISGIDLDYASWNGTNWTIQTIDEATASMGPSIKLDSSGYPHIVYPGIKGDLKYASWNGESWVIQSIDPMAGNSAEDASFQYLALDKNNQPHVIYSFHQSNQNWTVRYAYAIESSFPSGSWIVQTVLANPNIALGNIALDSNGNPHFVYALNGFFSSNGSLVYASLKNSAWNTQTVDSSIGAQAVERTYLALDSNNSPSIIYSNFHPNSSENLDDVKYAKWTGKTWDIQIADTSSIINGHMSVELDSNGNPHISYLSNSYGIYSISNGWLTYATINQSAPTPVTTTTPSSQPTQTPAPSPSVPEFPTWTALPGILVVSIIATLAIKRKSALRV